MASVHPFPARMAPELVEEHLRAFSPNHVLLDPMMGSGSFVLAAAERGHRSFGIDSDPLACIIAEAAAGNYDREELLVQANDIARAATASIGDFEASPDEETREFIDFWFDPRARDELAALAAHIERLGSPRTLAPLWCGFSRMIITKDGGASRARDTAHSRPHRVRSNATISPVEKFVSSVETVARRARTIGGDNLAIQRGDARQLPMDDKSIDGIVTSPPYLIAIDYLRGHRLSLVWMGHISQSLRELRSSNVGSERGSQLPDELQTVFESAVTGEMSSRKKNILHTYLKDIDRVLREQSRVLRHGGSLTHVVANARHGTSGISVENVVVKCAERHGLSLASRAERQLPNRSRYLPPPSNGSQSLDMRMHTEVIVTFGK